MGQEQKKAIHPKVVVRKTIHAKPESVFDAWTKLVSA